MGHTDPKSPKPSDVSPILREQIKLSLLNGPSKCSPDTPIDKALNESSSWQEFADTIGRFNQPWHCYIQDFALRYVEVNKQTFVRTDYGLGDNDFGTFHNIKAPAIICTVEDGDLHCDASPAVQPC